MNSLEALEFLTETWGQCHHCSKYAKCMELPTHESICENAKFIIKQDLIQKEQDIQDVIADYQDAAKRMFKYVEAIDEILDYLKSHDVSIDFLSDIENIVARAGYYE